MPDYGSAEPTLQHALEQINILRQQMSRVGVVDADYFLGLAIEEIQLSLKMEERSMPGTQLPSKNTNDDVEEHRLAG